MARDRCDGVRGESKVTQGRTGRHTRYRSGVYLPPPLLACASLERAAAIGRLNQALASHPLRPAFLHRARIEAVRRQAAADG
jgi:hypothetical protein